MRNILALVGFVVVLFAGLGWYLGWYSFTFKPDTDGKVNIQGSIDAKKIGEDGKKFTDTVGKAIQNFSQTPPTGQTNNLMGPPLPPELNFPGTSPTTSRGNAPASTNLPNGR
jgi:hypothetical protein